MEVFITYPVRYVCKNCGWRGYRRITSGTKKVSNYVKPCPKCGSSPKPSKPNQRQSYRELRDSLTPLADTPTE